MEKLTLDVLRNAISGIGAAFRCVTEYQPAGGVGDKIFPPTYEGGKYATEDRMINGHPVPCVLLDSVQSQANRMETALLEAWRTKEKDGSRRIDIPVITVRFNDDQLTKKFTVTSLDAPHRAADAILRDSRYKEKDSREVMFRKSTIGKILDHAEVRNATGLFGLNPTALIFGLWDSTGPRGGLGAKFQRALVSELVGFNAKIGCKTASRIDPAQIVRDSGLLYAKDGVADDVPDWTLSEKLAAREKDQPKMLGKKGKPSEANHGNVTPTIAEGGFTISHAQQTTVLSLAALRRLRFPLHGTADSEVEADIAARTVLAAIGLTAATLAREEGADLRSRCQLYPTQKFVWELLDTPGKPPKEYALSGDEAVTLLREAVQKAKEKSLPWQGEVILVPSPELIQLVARSQNLIAKQDQEGDE